MKRTLRPFRLAVPFPIFLKATGATGSGSAGGDRRSMLPPDDTGVHRACCEGIDTRLRSRNGPNDN